MDRNDEELEIDGDDAGYELIGMPDVGYELIGISLFGPPPLGEVHLPWDTGFYVAYGVNGAGKTVLLTAIDQVLRGLPTGGDAYVHIRVTGSSRRVVDEDGDPVGLIGWLCEALEIDYARRAGTSLENPNSRYLAFEREYPGVRGGSLDEILALGLRVELANDPVAANRIVEEAIPEMLISLSPDDDGNLFLYVSSLLGDNAPFLAARVGHWRASGLAGTHSHRLTQNGVTGTPESELLLFSERPPWMPLPICVVGKVTAFGVAEVITTEGLQDADALTTAVLRDSAFPSSDTQMGILPDHFFDEMSLIEDLANRRYKLLMLRAPELRLQLEDFQVFLDGRLVRWEAAGWHANEWLPLERLSRAQLRWAAAAIEFALFIFQAMSIGISPYIAVLVDEPESALHPQAIDHMLSGIQKGIATFMTVVATHSPHVLGTPGARLLNVSRDAFGVTKVAALDESLGNDLIEMAEALGLRTTDLMQIFQVVLIVEGLHDAIVLKTLFGNEWARARTRILQMSGGQNLASVAGCEVLLRFTNAEVVVMLDNATEHELPSVWERARELASIDRRPDALRMLSEFENEHRTWLTKEEATALEFCKASVGFGTAHRIHLYGLAERDIISYLDPGAFLNPGITWAQLAKEYRLLPRDLRKNKPFKDWLGKRPDCHTKPSRKSIEMAARMLADNPPRVFTDLLSVCRDLAGVAGQSV